MAFVTSLIEFRTSSRMGPDLRGSSIEVREVLEVRDDPPRDIRSEFRRMNSSSFLSSEASLSAGVW